MAAPALPARLAPRADTRELRVGFESRAGLLEGWLRAKREAWARELRVDLERCELVIAVGEPRPRPILCVIEGGREAPIG